MNSDEEEADEDPNAGDEETVHPGKRRLESDDESDDSEASYAPSPVKKRKVAD
jgi:hypothetical protein